MSTVFSMDLSTSDELIELLKKAEKAEEIVNNALKDFAADEIKKEIQPLINASGRKWKGKKASASTVQPFTETFSNLSVTVSTKSAYNYLYFPDDGSNTRKHAGQQQFMLRGAETATEKVIEEIKKRIIEQFE